MTIDKSLKVRAGLVRNRSVLTPCRTTCQASGDGPLVRRRFATRIAQSFACSGFSFKKKKKVKKEDEVEATEGEATSAENTS